MPLDSICLTAVRNELAEKLVGLKADKIQQPERDQCRNRRRPAASDGLRL